MPLYSLNQKFVDYTLHIFLLDNYQITDRNIVLSTDHQPTFSQNLA